MGRSLKWVPAERPFSAGTTTERKVAVNHSSTEAAKETRTTTTARRAAWLHVQVRYTPVCTCTGYMHTCVFVCVSVPAVLSLPAVSVLPSSKKSGVEDSTEHKGKQMSCDLSLSESVSQ